MRRFVMFMLMMISITMIITIYLILLLQSLTLELVNEIQAIRIREALPALVEFSESQTETISQRPKQEMQHFFPSIHCSSFVPNVNNDDEGPVYMFPRRREFLRSLPRRLNLSSCSSYRHDDHNTLMNLYHPTQDERMAVLRSPLVSHDLAANVYTYSPPSSISSHPALKSTPEMSSNPSLSFSYLSYTLPMITVCGHLGSMPSSTHNTLKYGRWRV